jgi:hypothetical protein
MHVFEATKNTKSEQDKAKFKNLNLPVLQHMFNGDKHEPLRCLVSGHPGWSEVHILVGESKVQFGIEFNHIKQRMSDVHMSAGKSIDRHPSYPPSGLFRKRMDTLDIIEFMTTIPVTADSHRHITNLSYKNNITLSCFPEDKWPWVLRCEENFNEFCAEHNLTFLNYEQFIHHLNDIEAPPIRSRIINDNGTYVFK